MSDAEPPSGPVPKPVPLAAFLRVEEPPPPDPGPPPPDPEAIYAEGFRDGAAAAAAEAAESARAAEEAHRLALAAADEAARALAEALAGTLAEAALAIARAVLAGEPAIRPQLLHRLVADILAAAPAEAQGRLHVHPEALALLAGTVPPGWILVGDPTLERHAVRAELGSHQLLASLSTRLAAAAAALGAGA